ncbi:MAG: alpha/beta hydrolase-fold protein [Anaerolineae bacterium]
MASQLWQPYPAREIVYTPTIGGTLLIQPDVYSPQLDNERDVLVYLPPSYGFSDRHYPVIYMQDGQNLFDSATAFAGSHWHVDETMDMLAGEGIEAIVVGVNHANEQRINEYNPFPYFWQGRGDVYLRFLTETLKPQIDRDFRTRPQREATGILGSSMGGLISVYAYFHAQETFGYAGVMSPSLWVAGGAIIRSVHDAPFAPGRVYIDNGTREPSARRLHGLLCKKGYVRDLELRYVVEVDAEHTESAWARRLPDALRFLLPR